MNKKMMKKYLRTLIFAVAFTLFLGCILCYVLFFSGRTLDLSLPQYLILNIGENLSASSDGITLDSEGMDLLDSYNSWLQLVDNDGNVVFSYNTNSDIPENWSSYELLNATLASDRLPGYTVYANSFEDEGEYILLIGCSSRLVTKHSYTTSGSSATLSIKCIIVFALAAVISVLTASYVYSKQVSVPVSVLIENLEMIANDKEPTTQNHSRLFEDVFLCVQNLWEKLNSNKKMRAEWISNISHDIRTPLSTVKGYAEFLSNADYQFEAAEVRQYASEILKSAETIQGLIDDLKISQTLSEGKYTPNKESVNLTKLITDCIQLINPKLIGNSHILYEPKADIYLDCDLRLMARCLINIISNAFVHNPNTELTVQIDIVKSDGHVTLHIHDNGKGMTQDDIDHAFERYYRGTASGQSDGTGLGLAIAKETISAHGGTIKLESEPGAGVLYTIIL